MQNRTIYVWVQDDVRGFWGEVITDDDSYLEVRAPWGEILKVPWSSVKLIDVREEKEEEE